MTQQPSQVEVQRNGGDLVVESLRSLGVDTVFGIPGQHALGLFDALNRSPLKFFSSRVENNAAFAADGFARAAGANLGAPAVLFLSTGPGALTSLAGLQEAHATGVPVLVVSSQVPIAGVGLRSGMLHELDDQQASARNIARYTRLVRHASEIPSVIAEAVSVALSAPSGPAWVEVPQDILLAPTDVPPVSGLDIVTSIPEPRRELIEQAAQLLAAAERPAIVAGGGVRRAGAHAALLELAERVDAPVISSPGGNGAFPRSHPLSVGAYVEDRLTTQLLNDADVLLAIGTSLGEITSNYFTLAPRGRVVQIDAESRVLESNHPALAIHADARIALEQLVNALDAASPNQSAVTQPAVTQQTQQTSGAERAAELVRAVEARLDSQGLEAERGLIASIRAAVPDDAHTFWDMTIAGYWAWSTWDPRGGGFHSAQGAGGLGYAYPAALGGAVAAGARVLAVSGDGGAMYSIAELATARQHDLPVTWLIIDDGGYGILREYMVSTFGQATATELARPDFVLLAESFGVPAKRTTLDTLQVDLEAAWKAEGPNVVVCETVLRMFAPTHLAKADEGVS